MAPAKKGRGHGVRAGDYLSPPSPEPFSPPVAFLTASPSFFRNLLPLDSPFGLPSPKRMGGVTLLPVLVSVPVLVSSSAAGSLSLMLLLGVTSGFSSGALNS